MYPLILLPAKTDLIPKEEYGIKNLDRPSSSSGSKIVFTLLTEVVADFPWYMFREWAFSFFRDALEITGAEVGAGTGGGVGVRAEAQASKIALRILCMSSSKYLGTLIAATGASAIGGFIPEGLAGCSNISSPDLGSKEESKRATEEATEGRSWQGRPRPWTEVILELISSKNTLSNGLADPLSMERLEL